MHRPHLSPLYVCLSLLATAPALAQQTGTLQLPSHRMPDAPPKAPTPAPRVPVHQETTRRTPVVQPHGASPHAHKPPTPQTHAKPSAAASTHGKPPAAAQAAKPAAPAQPHAAKPATAAAATAAAATAAATAAAKPEPAKPAPEDKADEAKSDGLKLPRFAALRSDEVNLRAGPGTRYPIEWVYKRRDLPVEIEREFEVWRLVRDMDGIRGWMHQATLTGRRTFLVVQHDATLRAEPKDGANAVAVLKPGVIGRIRSCQAGSDWCQMQAGTYRGYLRREQVWGVLPDEAVTP